MSMISSADHHGFAAADLFVDFSVGLGDAMGFHAVTFRKAAGIKSWTDTS
jgi:hypothetical protein